MKVDSPCWDLVVVGAGAAGHFAAAQCLEHWPSAKVLILESGPQTLRKVKISGGGRCNLTHACFNPRELVNFYPRGSKEMLGPFHHFGPRQTLDWFESKSCKAVAEADGRMFPLANTSAAVIEVLRHSVQKAQLVTRCPLVSISKADSTYYLKTKHGEHQANAILMSSGSSEAGYKCLESLGVSLIPRRPSIFSLKVPGLTELAGGSLNAALCLKLDQGKTMHQSGPILFTHKGLSGPAILRLTAFGARELYDSQYRAELEINLVPQVDLDHELSLKQKKNGQQSLAKSGHFGLSKKVWCHRLKDLNIDHRSRWKQLNAKQLKAIKHGLQQWTLEVTGKSPHKEEFVTCGGVDLKQVDFKRMESKQQKGLFFAGEVLNVDGVTGGFNFQAAWTTAHLAAMAIVEDGYKP